MHNQKIFQVIDQLQSKSDYEQENKEQFLEKDRMLAITRSTGKFYNILLKSIGANRILEIGLSHGYSTLWFADAILAENKSNDSRITTIEKDESKVKIAHENFRKAGIEGIITIKHGDAIDTLNDILKEFETKKSYFDFVFIDADKENSIKYFEMCFPMVRKNGIIAADNVLDMKEMKEYMDYVNSHTGVQTITLPIGWGQELSLKLND